MSSKMRIVLRSEISPSAYQPWVANTLLNLHYLSFSPFCVNQRFLFGLLLVFRAFCWSLFFDRLGHGAGGAQLFSEIGTKPSVSLYTFLVLADADRILPPSFRAVTQS